ncbi:hypothetical protein VNO77_11269 [Canavalia gladiata]|uniref:Uncharacterized protein n=1 Tax=Canavalia gladiata TaxID=3824 RepID=A0AAN9QYA1_CANGL
MEVAVSSPNGSPTKDPFDFNHARISPYLSAPSSPKRFGECYYLSAPASPSRFYTQLDYFSIPNSPFEAGIPRDTQIEDDDDFAFFVNGQAENPSRSAEELFDDGKIKPIKEEELFESSKSPLLPRARPQPKIGEGKKPIEETVEEGLSGERRGRNRSVSSSNSSRRVARSHSPFRTSEYTWEQEPQQAQRNKEESESESVSVPTKEESSSKSSRKWRLMRDFLLFRSASEGRGSSKDPFRKFNVLYKKLEEPKPSTPARSSDIRKLRRKEPVSAHELHYARKKAEAQDLKKKTFLPYKQGILGRLAGLGK